jgi:hypothetical protein
VTNERRSCILVLYVCCALVSIILPYVLRSNSQEQNSVVWMWFPISKPELALRFGTRLLSPVSGIYCSLPLDRLTSLPVPGTSIPTRYLQYFQISYHTHAIHLPYRPPSGLDRTSGLTASSVRTGTGTWYVLPSQPRGGDCLMSAPAERLTERQLVTVRKEMRPHVIH